MIRYVHERGYEGDGKDPNITLGKTYIALGIYFRPNSLEYPPLVCIACDSDEDPAMFELRLFDFVDERVPNDWGFKITSNGWYALFPQEFLGDFWERFHDADEQAEKIFQQVRAKLEQFHELL